MAPPTPFTPALIVVDLQEDFCPPAGALPVPDGRAAVAPINTLLTLPFVLKLATKDWHPADHISFALNHPLSPPPFVSSITITHPDDVSHTYESTLWPVHCVQHTPGARLVPELDVAQIGEVVCKGTDARVEMYSAFCDPFHWGGVGVSDSGIAGRLKEKGVTDVFVVGLAMDYCVKATAEDAVRFGFRTWVVREGTRAVGGEEAAKIAEEEMGRAGVKCVGLEGEEVSWVRALAGVKD